jgi:hypothetical protein
VLVQETEPPIHAGTPKKFGPGFTRKGRDWIGPLDGVIGQVSDPGDAEVIGRVDW